MIGNVVIAFNWAAVRTAPDENGKGVVMAMLMLAQRQGCQVEMCPG